MPADAPTNQSLRIAAIYGFFAAAWILCSDQLVAFYFSDAKTLTIIATMKGWFFVAVTSAMLFVLVRRQLAQVRDTHLAQSCAEEAVRRSEARLRSITDLSPDIISIFDKEGHLVFNSSAAYKIHGYREQDLLGRATFDLIHPEDLPAVHKAFTEILEEPNKPHVIRYRYRNADSSYVWMEASARNELANPLLQGIISISRDISERMNAEEERRHMQEQLIRAQKMEAIGQLAGGVAHDFNNILTVLSMNLSSLKEEELPGHVREVCNELEGATGRAAALTRQLLLFARRQVVQKHELELNALVGRLLNMLRRLIGENIVIEYHGNGQPAWVMADTSMMEQVVMNLAVNARDSMPQGGRLGIGISNETLDTPANGDAGQPNRRAGQFVRLEVSDTGCGIEESTLQKIFEPFFTTKALGKGTGLGLATVFGILQQHDGWIEVDSVIGKGSTFRVYLPQAQPAIESQEPVPAPLRHGNEAILLSEDDPGVRQLCMNTLVQHGYRVVVAENGLDALAKWKMHQGAFDLLLTDMIMPEGLTGLDLAERLRAEKPKLKVIVMSGYSLELSQHAGLETKNISYLPKPFNPPTLTQVMRAVLDAV